MLNWVCQIHSETVRPLGVCLGNIRPPGSRDIAYRFPERRAPWAVAANPPPVRSPFPSRRGAAPHSGIAVWSCPKWPRHPRHRAAISVVPACRVSPYRWTMRSRWTFGLLASQVRDVMNISSRFGAINLGYGRAILHFFVDGKLTDGRCQEANSVGSRWTVQRFRNMKIFWNNTKVRRNAAISIQMIETEAFILKIFKRESCFVETL